MAIFIEYPESLEVAVPLPRRKRVLITGSTGLVGSAAVEYFSEQGWEVVGIDNDMRRAFFGTASQDPQVKLDIRNEGAVDALFQAHKFDAIIHTAAQPSHDWSKDHPMVDFYVNVVGTMNLLEATRRWAKDATFVFVSTDKVYGENMVREPLQELETRWHHDKPYAEDLSLDHSHHTPFGAGKASADLYVQEYGYQYGIKTACFRCGCITGRNHQGAEQHGFLAYLAKCIKEGKTYKIYGYKGKQVRDQIHAYDLVAAFERFINRPTTGAVYNIGGGPERSVSILEAGELVSKETGKEFIHEYIDEPRFGDRQWDVHDVSKFRRDYPEWDYKYDLPAIVKDVCNL